MANDAGRPCTGRLYGSFNKLQKLQADDVWKSSEVHTRRTTEINRRLRGLKWSNPLIDADDEEKF